MAFLLLKSSDQSKYRSLLNGLTSQYSMDNNQYPKMIMAASDILAYHKHDAIDQDKQRRMMKEAQVMPTMRPASRKAGKRSTATAVERRGISALTVQRRMKYRETNGLFVKPSNICRRSKVNRMKTVHPNKKKTRRPNGVSTNKPP